MQRFNGYPLLPQTECDGFTYGAITPIGLESERGAGFLQAPDGTRAGLQWELSDSPFIARVDGPDGSGWGVYQVGFTQPVWSVADLIANLEPLLPKLKILHSRIRRPAH